MARRSSGPRPCSELSRPGGCLRPLGGLTAHHVLACCPPREVICRPIGRVPARASVPGSELHSLHEEDHRHDPHETAIVVKADLPLLGSFAGALVGLPDAAVKEHLRATPLEELM